MARPSLREFIVTKLGNSVVAIVDRPQKVLDNFVEGFVVLTTKSVGNSALRAVLEEYYSNGEVVVRCKTHHWVTRPGQPRLLIDVINYSPRGGATYFGENEHRGGIGFIITSHPT